MSCLLLIYRNSTFKNSQYIATDKLNIKMSYSSTALGGRPENECLNLQFSDLDSTYLQGQCYEYLTIPEEPRKSSSWDLFHTPESGTYHQGSAFMHQSINTDYENAPASLIPSPLESHNFFSSGPYFSHDDTSPTDDGSWNDSFTMQPMINTATNDLFSDPRDRNCGNFDNYNFFPPPDSTLGDPNVDPSLESTINLVRPLRLVDSPDQPLEQALQFAGQPDFPNNHDQPFSEDSGMYTSQARSTSKVKILGMYSQYNLASGELKYPFSSHLPQPVGRPATSSIVSPREFASPGDFLGHDGLESHSDFVSQIKSLQNTAPLLDNLSLTTSHLSSSGAPHTSIKESSTRRSTSTTTKKRSTRTCSHCLSKSHNISQCPLEPCRHCSQMDHVSKDCETRKTKNKVHRRVATRERRRIEKLLKVGRLLSEIEPLHR